METILSRLTPQEIVATHRPMLDTSLRSILDSRFFRNSKRFPALLEYAVQQSLMKNIQNLKERTIGVEVFGRPLNYDPGTDPVVRVAFGEMRKRLVIYYSEHPDTPIRIDFPVGSYIAEFSFADEPAAAPELPSAVDDTPALDPAPDAVLLPLATHAQRLRARLRNLSKHWRWLALALTLLMTTVGAVTWHSLRQARKLDFWRPIFSSGNTPAIIVGEGPSFDLAGQFKKPAPTEGPNSQPNPIRPKSLPMKLGNAQGVAQICGIFRTYDRECQITSANLVSFAEMRHHNIVLVGGVNNFWSIRTLEPLRFHFAFDTPNSPAESRQLSIVDRENPESAPAWSIPTNEDLKSTSEYAIIARFHSDFTDGNVVVVGGLGPLGTACAGEFIAKPGNMRNILSQASKNWAGYNFELVLQTDTVLYHCGHSKVLATTFW